jgi:dTMP kinase
MSDATPKARVIAFEGVDGAGKSTVINIVAEHLRGQGIPIFLPRTGKEHSSRPTRMIRRLTRDRCNLALEAMPEFLLYAAREAQVLGEQVRPALARGETVLLDRSMWTPIVLGSFGRGLDFETALQVADAASGGLRPDVTMIFDVDPRTSRIRKRLDKIRTRRSRDGGRKGLGGSGLKVRVREGYSQLASKEGFPVFHAERGTPAEVAQRAISFLDTGSFSEGPLDGTPNWQVDPGLGFEQALSALPDLVQLYFSRRMMLGRAIRAKLVNDEPRLVAWASDREDPVWETLDRVAPDERASRFSALPYVEGGWRENLAEEYPVLVARSLKGNGVEADAFRERLAQRVPGAVCESLSGRSDPAAVEMRKRLWKEADVHERAISINRLSDEKSTKRREKIMREDPAVGLVHLKGLTSEQTDAHLSHWAPFAPKAVLKALNGRTDEFAHALRRELIESGREVIDTIRGLDDAASWELREQYAARWPSTVAWSCAGLGGAADARVAALLDTCRQAAPGDLFLKRRIYQLEVLGRLDDDRRKNTADDFDA